MADEGNREPPYPDPHAHGVAHHYEGRQAEVRLDRNAGRAVASRFRVLRQAERQGLERGPDRKGLGRADGAARLFTDVVMPDMSGRQLVDQARLKQPGLKVLYTPGYTRNAIVHNGILDEGTILLTKPFSIDELALKVRKLLDE
jgi:CheY-like chemotaxis protein